MVQVCEPSECKRRHSLGGSATAVDRAIGTTLYLTKAAAKTRSFLRFDPSTGIPALPPARRSVTSFEPPFGPFPENGGLHQVRYSALPEPTLFMSSYDFLIEAPVNGAIYRAPISALPLLGGGESATQWGPTFTTHGFLVAPNGAVFAQDGATKQLLKIEGTPPTTSTFADNTGSVRAIGDSFVYVSSIGTREVVRALAQDGSGQAGASPPGPPDAPALVALDARHPSYVVYIRGNTIHRWPKPVR